MKDENSSFSSLAKYAGLGYYLVTPLLIGVFLGLVVDHFLQTQPICILIGIFLGVGVTFYNLINLTKRS